MGHQHHSGGAGHQPCSQGRHRAGFWGPQWTPHFGNPEVTMGWPPPASLDPRVTPNLPGPRPPWAAADSGCGTPGQQLSGEGSWLQVAPRALGTWRGPRHSQGLPMASMGFRTLGLTLTPALPSTAGTLPPAETSSLGLGGGLTSLLLATDSPSAGPKPLGRVLHPQDR